MLFFHKKYVFSPFVQLNIIKSHEETSLQGDLHLGASSLSVVCDIDTVLKATSRNFFCLL
jgi:hypothetical protein